VLTSPGVPVTYRHDREAARIHTRCTGQVTLDEVSRHFRQLERDASLPARLDVLLDLTACESVPESCQLRVVASDADRLQEKVRWGACAIVASRDALFGMSRMFEVFAEGVFADTRVFREMDAAERWLESLHPPAA
jgi:SpoIIAA-like